MLLYQWQRGWQATCIAVAYSEGRLRSYLFPIFPQAGIAFDRLFQLCREQFLVSNETLLSSFLTEFRDHDLLKARYGDGQNRVGSTGIQQWSAWGSKPDRMDYS